MLIVCGFIGIGFLILGLLSREVHPDGNRKGIRRFFYQCAAYLTNRLPKDKKTPGNDVVAQALVILAAGCILAAAAGTALGLWNEKMGKPEIIGKP